MQQATVLIAASVSSALVASVVLQLTSLASSANSEQAVLVATAIAACVATTALVRLLQQGPSQQIPAAVVPPPIARPAVERLSNYLPTSEIRPLSRTASKEGAEPSRVAILGGAFNPPTNQHIQLATEIVHSGQVDAVWLMPCGPRPDKPDMGATPQQRLIMCEIAVNTTVSATFPLSVTDHETQEAMATYDSLCYLRTRYPECVFSFVVGSDWLQPGTDLRKWESKAGMTGDKLVSEFDFLVIRRPGYDVDDLQQYGPRFTWMDLPHGFKLVESTASSTEIRKRAAQSWSAEAANSTALSSLDGLVAPGVHAYILRHKLYRKATWRMVRERHDTIREMVRNASSDDDDKDKQDGLGAAKKKKKKGILSVF